MLTWHPVPRARAWLCALGLRAARGSSGTLIAQGVVVKQHVNEKAGDDAGGFSGGRPDTCEPARSGNFPRAALSGITLLRAISMPRGLLQ